MLNGWLRKFDEPIEASDDTQLKTLREAVAYLAKTVPKSERNMPAVATAAEPIRGLFVPSFCARADSGHVPAATLTSLMNSRRCMCPSSEDAHLCDYYSLAPCDAGGEWEMAYKYPRSVTGPHVSVGSIASFWPPADLFRSIAINRRGRGRSVSRTCQQATSRVHSSG